MSSPHTCARPENREYKINFQRETRAEICRVLRTTCYNDDEGGPLLAGWLAGVSALAGSNNKSRWGVVSSSISLI